MFLLTSLESDVRKKKKGFIFLSQETRKTKNHGFSSDPGSEYLSSAVDAIKFKRLTFSATLGTTFVLITDTC